MKTPATFKQIDLERALRAFRKQGIENFEVVITATAAKIVAQPTAKTDSDPVDKSWDA